LLYGLSICPFKTSFYYQFNLLS